MRKIKFTALTVAVMCTVLIITNCKKANNQTLTNTGDQSGLQKKTLAALLWNGDASLGTGVFKVLDIDSMGSISAVTDANAGTVWKLYKPLNNHRTELHAAKNYEAAEGSDIYIGWRSKLDMATNIQTNAVFQWKAYGSNMTQNYPIVIKTLSTGKLQLEFYSPGKILHILWNTPLTTNVWNDFVLHLKVSRDDTVGFIEFWYNGVMQTLNSSSTRYYARTLDADYCDPKWGVYGGDAYTITNYVSAPKIGSTYADAAPARVTLYQNCSYGGWSATFGPGNYTTTDLTNAGGVNDDASAIKVPSGLKATLYQNNNYGGTSVALTTDQSCLSGISFNDLTSSFKVVTN
jgi:hypothetical protein